MLNKFFTDMLYVKVYKNKFVVKNLSSNLPGQMFTSDTPFTTTRLLIGTFAPAMQCLKHAISGSISNSWLKAKPSVLMQPMEMHEGGLSEVEERVLRECALDAGARKVIVWTGQELSNDKAVEKINSSH